MTKYAIVTGGTRGIGFGIVTKLYNEGFTVASLGRKTNDELEQLIKTSNGKVKFFQVNISDIESIKKSFKAITQEFSHIDLLVNNAGVAPKERVDLLEVSEEGFDYVLDTNLKGTFFMSQIVAKYMIDNKVNNNIFKIINISSLSAYTSSVNRGEYCISKAGISMLTKLFADRLSSENILVYEIRPGIIKTDMTKAVNEKYEKEINDGLLPIKRWGRPEDIANIVYVLALPEFSYSTGDVINVDGGFHIRRL